MPNRAVQEQQLNKARILSKAVINTASYLDIPKNKLSHILGLSPSTVTRLYTHSYHLAQNKKEWDFAVLFVRMFRSLDTIVGNPDDAKKWLKSENSAFAGRKPADLIETTEGLVRVVSYLDASRAVI